MGEMGSDQAAFAQLFGDLVVNVMAMAESPGRCCEYIAQQVRELIGVRTVVVMQCVHRAGGDKHALLAVSPQRRRELALSPELERLAWLSHAMEQASRIGPDSPGEAGAAARTLGLGPSLALPLAYAGNRMGVLFLLDILDQPGAETIIRSLDQLAPILALILRNASLYNNLESEVARRTAALEQSEANFKEYVDNAPDGIVIFDAAGTVLDVNPAACRLTGLARQTLLARPFHDLIDPESRVVWARALAELSETKRIEVELSTLRRDGARGYWQIKAVAMTAAKRIAFATDVTERKTIENELVQSKEAAEEASRAKSEFLANMSHEIRTPLNGILGMLQLLQTTALDAEQLEYADMAIQSSRRLTRLLSDILDLSRVEAGKMTMHVAPFTLKAAIRQVEELFIPIARNSGVALRSVVDPRLPEKLIGDTTRLQQVLTNLIGNAFKFTRRGQVRLEASALPGANENLCRVLFSVEDTGIGIPPDKLGLLFEPFTQASEGLRRSHQGAGLGLSICKRLVGLMGGEITVASESDVGTGAYFCLALDLADDAARPQAVPDAACAPGVAAAAGVLLVEDDFVTQISVKRWLEKSGYRVVAAGDGQQALQALREQDVDLILMDIQMPVMDGLETARRIRQGAAGADKAAIPIIAMTAYAMTGDRERFLAAGMDAYAAKPVDLAAFGVVIEQTLARAASLRG